MLEKTIRFLKLNEQIKSEYLALQVYDSQKNFIETPLGSLTDMESRAYGIPWEIECIFAGNRMVGYAMHGISPRGDVWLDRLMIDKRFQGNGYGTCALSQIIPLLKDRYKNRRHIFLSVEPENTVAIALYKKFGFFFTGDIEDGEKVMLLKE